MDEDVFVSVMRWVENLWIFVDSRKEFNDLNIKVYGGIIRYMITRRGTFNDLDLYLEREENDEKESKEVNGRKELEINNKIESLFYLLHREGLITEYTKRWFTNFDPPLLNFKFKIIMYDRSPTGLMYDAELITGRPYNPFSKIDFVLNNFNYTKEGDLEIRIEDPNIPNNNLTIVNSNVQEFLLKFKNPDELVSTADCVGELFKMYRLYLMFDRGYNIIANSRLPIFKFTYGICKICKLRGGNKVMLCCDHHFHPHCLFQSGKNKNPYTKGLCPGCNYGKPIKLKLIGNENDLNTIIH